MYHVNNVPLLQPPTAQRAVFYPHRCSKRLVLFVATILTTVICPVFSYVSSHTLLLLFHIPLLRAVAGLPVLVPLMSAVSYAPMAEAALSGRDRLPYTQALLLGLNYVPTAGSPGAVIAFGENSFCALTTKTGHCVLGAAEYGRGRVVAVGHNGYIIDIKAHPSNDKQSRLARLMRNTVIWTGHAECRSYGAEGTLQNELLSPCTPFCDDDGSTNALLPEFLSTYPFGKNGLQCRLPLKISALGITQNKLKDIVAGISAIEHEDKFVIGAAEPQTTYDSIIKLLNATPDVILWTNADCNNEVTPSAKQLDSRAEALLSFVNQGGALIVAVCPWGWNSLCKGDYLSTRCVFNHVLKMTGLMYSEDGVSGDEGGKYLTATAIEKVKASESPAEAMATAAQSLVLRQSLSRSTVQHVCTILGGLPDVVLDPGSNQPKGRAFLPDGSAGIQVSVRSLEHTLTAFGPGAVSFPFKMDSDQLSFGDSVKFLYAAWLDNYWRVLPPVKCPKAAKVEEFPGDVAFPVARVSNFLFTMNPKLGGWQTTGIYSVAGEVLTITISDQALAAYPDLELEVRVGCHRDSLHLFKADDKKYKLNRYPKITSSRRWHPRDLQAPDEQAFTHESGPETAAVIQVATPYGGLLYIEYRNGWLDEKNVPLSFSIDGGVMAPFWSLQYETNEIMHNIYTDSYPHRQGSVSDRARQMSAPWGEVEGRYITMSVSREALMRATDDMNQVIGYWDAVVGHELALSGQKIERRERLVWDKQISAGWLHSGYPVMGHLAAEEITERGLPGCLDYQKMTNGAQWGVFHEFGHNRQKWYWGWRGTTEANVNIFSLYCTQMLHGRTPFKSSYWIDNARKPSLEYLRNHNKTFEKDWQGNGKYNTALGTFVTLIEIIGWQSLADAFHGYEQVKGHRPSGDANVIQEWIRRTSVHSKLDLRDFYRQWKFPIDNSKLKELDSLPKWHGSVEKLIIDNS